MFVIIWEFRVKKGSESLFERMYGSDGDWVKLFKTDASYLGTEFLRDHQTARRYVTLDRWTSEEKYLRFREQRNVEYEAIDKACDVLTEHDAHLGSFLA